MHERNLLPWNMFTQISSKWRRIFCERLINISWKNHLQQLAAGNCLGAIIWGVIMRGVIILGTIILAPIAWEPYFFRGSCLAGNYSWGQSSGGAILLKEIGLVAVVRRGGGNSLWGSYPLGNCHGNNCPRTLRQAPEIGKFHWFSFTSEKSMLNSQQNFHWTFNHQRVTPFNLANLFLSEVCRHTSKMNNKCYLLTQKKYHPCEAALRNAHEIGIQVPPHPPILMSLLKNQKTFMYAMLVQVILPINT